MLIKLSIQYYLILFSINSFNWLENIGIALFIYFICLNIISIIKHKKIVVDINNGKIPEIVENFPVHNTSSNAYLASKNKVEQFINSALIGQHTELKLTQDDLNNLYTKGINLNKYTPGRYLYYQIKDNFVIEKLIEGPLYIPPNPYRSRKTEFSFSNSELKQHSRIIEEYEKPIKGSLETFPLSISSLILFILGASNSPDKLPLKFNKTVEYQRAMILLEKIKSIEVDSGYLILRT